jgi:SagB-type dehydrogenase family enzyme
MITKTKNRAIKITSCAAIILLCTLTLSLQVWSKEMEKNKKSAIVELPKPKTEGTVSLETTLLKRRSIRDFRNEPVSLASVSQLLWAAQGITNSMGFRTAPSAGALYPLELYIVVANVTGLNPGIYHYSPQKHNLTLEIDGDKRKNIANAALGQGAIQEAPIVFVFTSVHQRVTMKYGKRGLQYISMEVGHAAQNLCLQAVALDLGSVVIGAFYEDKVSGVLELKSNCTPMYIVPVGYKK